MTLLDILKEHFGQRIKDTRKILTSKPGTVIDFKTITNQTIDSRADTPRSLIVYEDKVRAWNGFSAFVPVTHITPHDPQFFQKLEELIYNED